MQSCTYHCGTLDHLHSRRDFLWGTAGGICGFAGMNTATSAQSLQQSQKRVLVINLAGGVSQLETWDPHPGTNIGGEVQALKTTIPNGYDTCFFQIEKGDASSAERWARYTEILEKKNLKLANVK